MAQSTPLRRGPAARFPRMGACPRMGTILAAAAILFLAGATLAMAQGLPDSTRSTDPERSLLIHDDSSPNRLTPERVQPGSESFTDPSTDLKFPKNVTIKRLDGSDIHLTAVGSGVRKKLIVKVYGAALYSDSAVPLGESPINSLNREDMARRLVMTFKRGVDGGKIREAYREGLVDKVWKSKPTGDLAYQFDRFLEYFDQGVKEGESIELTYIPGEGLYTVIGGKAEAMIGHPEIARRIWSVWLGPSPVSEDLKKALVRLVAPKEK